MKTLISLPATAVLLSLSTIVYGQSPPPITTELRRITYQIESDGKFARTLEVTRIINAESGIRAGGQVNLPYNKSIESIEVREAWTKQSDGMRQDVPPSSIFDQKAPNAIGGFDDSAIRSIVFPQVSVGSKINYKVKLTQHNPIFERQFSAIELVSPHEDIQKAEFIFDAPKGMLFAVAHEMQSLKATSVDREKFVFQAKNDSPLPIEAGSVALRDYSPSVIVSSYQTPASFASAYEALNAIEYDHLPIQDKAEKIIGAAKGNYEKAALLFDWVKANIRYVSVALGNGGWRARSPTTTLANGYGDCKDKVALLAALLSAVGIKSEAALVHAGNSYWEPMQVAPGLFNHMIAYVPEFDLYLDPTESEAPFGILPLETAGKRVLHVQTKRWGFTPKGTIDATVTQVVKLTKDGKLEGRAEAEARGSQAIILRRIFSTTSAAPEKQIAESMLTALQISGKAALKAPSNNLRLEPMSIAFEYEGTDRLANPQLRKIGIPRSPFSSISSSIDELQKVRRFPVPCPSISLREITQVELETSSAAINSSVPRQTISRTNSQGVMTFTAQTEARNRKLSIERTLKRDSVASVCLPEKDAELQTLLRAAAKAMQLTINY